MKFCFFICVTLLIFSCEKEKHKQKSNEKSKYTLNGNQKWEMDDHTRKSINQMQHLFDTTSIEKIESYNSFAFEFESILDSLIKGCTMEGEAHEQLHIFIGEIFQPLENLKKDSVIEEATKSHNKLKNALTEYDKYFK